MRGCQFPVGEGNHTRFRGNLWRKLQTSEGGWSDLSGHEDLTESGFKTVLEKR